MWMFVVLAEEVDTRNHNQYKEVQGHQKVICNSSGRQHLACYSKGLAKSCKVYRSADIGAGKYTCQCVQLRNEVAKHCKTYKGAHHGTDRTA